MLYNLLFPLADVFSPFNLFRYLTFRTGGAVITAPPVRKVRYRNRLNGLKTSARGKSRL